MTKVLVTLKVSDAEKEAFISKYGDSCSFEFCAPKKATPEMLRETEILIGGMYDDKICPEAMPKLKLWQLPSAGADEQAKLPYILSEGGPVLCNATGAYGITISEYMMGQLIVLLRHFQIYRDHMKGHEWQREELPEVIYGKTALLLGVGDIGGNLAKRLKAFDCKVIAIKRTSTVPEFVDEVHTMADLEELLPQADFICCSLPNSPSTTKLINEKTLALMKPTAILVNVGRGTLVDSDALAKALNEGRLGGTALDVTDPEPLPEDHPLWDCPNCMITPHVAGLSEQREPHQRIVGFAMNNIGHYLRGEEFENLVDLKTGYKVSK
ncbi:MAG: D-2-hydroxyacid dehydrogenase [Firmicutes bacterium]|nr:D-2-hydroxyacid dehydrogenase [Bacillota bacterium]